MVKYNWQKFTADIIHSVFNKQMTKDRKEQCKNNTNQTYSNFRKNDIDMVEIHKLRLTLTYLMG